MSANDTHIGKRVRVTTSGVAGVPSVIEADLFAIDGARGLAVLRRVHTHTYQKADYFFVPVAALTEIQVLGDADRPAIISVQPAESEKRLRDAIAAENVKLSRKGVGVSERSQRIFDELLKHFPRATWKERVIVLDDTGTVISSPHGLNDIVYGSSCNDMYKSYLNRNVEAAMAKIAQQS